MAAARAQAEWAQTSSVIAWIVNVNRDTRKCREPFSPADFNPFAKKKPEPMQKGSIEDLKIFLPGGAYGRSRST